MKKFIKKNDIYLHRAKLFLTVYLILMSLIIGVLAVICFVGKAIGAGVCILIGGILGLIVIDFIVKLFLSLLVDVKLIRNKLYQENEGDGETVKNEIDEELKKFYDN